MHETVTARRDYPSRPASLEASPGYWIFRNRSWLPVPLALVLAIVKPSPVEPSLVWAGLTCIVAGEMVRLWAVRHIGVLSRTRTMTVGPLVTSGPYAHTRNPLYVGNWLLWTGFALASSIRWMVPLSWIVFAVQHAIVVHWEEHLLARLYPKSYARYAGHVPRWWPRLFGARASQVLHPWGDVLFSERGTLAAIAGMGILLAAKYLIR